MYSKRALPWVTYIYVTHEYINIPIVQLILSGHYRGKCLAVDLQADDDEVVGIWIDQNDSYTQHRKLTEFLAIIICY